MIPLLVVGHLVFAAICSPMGVRSGDWAVAGFPDPDFLVTVAAGATLACPLILYATWAGLGSGHFASRYGTTLLMCGSFVGVIVLRGMARGNREPQVLPVLFAVVGFTLMAIAFWAIQRLARWRLFLSPDMRPAEPIQFRLTLLFQLVALAAVLAALYRLRFPSGLPAEMTADGWRQVARIAPAFLMAITILLPTALVPWFVLRSATGYRSWIFAVMVAAAVWVVWTVERCSFSTGSAGSTQRRLTLPYGFLRAGWALHFSCDHRPRQALHFSSAVHTSADLKLNF